MRSMSVSLTVLGLVATISLETESFVAHRKQRGREEGWAVIGQLEKRATLV